MTLSADTLRSVVKYCPDSGDLVWRARDVGMFRESSRRSRESSAKAWNTRYAGSKALSHVAHNGYLYGNLLGFRILAHRAAWAAFYGGWPATDIDHINGVRSDNRIENLRLATRSENQLNRAGNSNRIGMPKGVFKSTSGKRWIARLVVNGQRYHGGTHDTIEEAARAYNELAAKFAGKFSRPNHEFLAVVADMLAGEWNE